MFPPIPSPSSVAEAVQEYNARFGSLDMNLWSLGQLSVKHFPEEQLAANEDFVWAVKRWGSIQGVWLSDRPSMASALRDLQLAVEPEECFDRECEESIVQLVKRLVLDSRVYGVRRSHYSWASKILHWRLPQMVPVYDSFARRYVGQGSKEGETAYRAIVAWEYETARQLTPFREMIVGDVEPRFLLRAIDKFVWWVEGGKVSHIPR